MEIFFSAGEPSGDVHGANLIRELRRRDAGLRCVGYGGPRMSEAGCQLHADLTRDAVMWFWRVLLKLHYFWRLIRQTDRYFAQSRIDAAVLIDYPGFNWWIARCAQKHSIPVFYYGVPQIWAWAPWRIRKMRRLVDHALCQLPFEEDYFAQRGCRATYVGHPFFDETRQHVLDATFLRQQASAGGPLVTLLPGSRTQEVTSNLPSFLRAAARIGSAIPATRFAIAAVDEHQARLAHACLAGSSVRAEIHVGRTPELIAAAECCLACSGSVSLELLSYEKPSVIHYRIGRLAFLAQGYFRKVKYITLANLLAAREIFYDRLQSYDPHGSDAEEVPFPEYLTCEDKSRELAQHVITWLTIPAERERCVEQLRVLKRQVAQGGASRRAAEYIFQQLAESQTALRAG